MQCHQTWLANPLDGNIIYKWRMFQMSLQEIPRFSKHQRRSSSTTRFWPSRPGFPRDSCHGVGWCPPMGWRYWHYFIGYVCDYIYIYHYNMHIDHCIFPILMAFWWALCPPIWWDFLPKRRRTRHSTMRGEILLHPVSGWKVLLGTCCSLNPYLGWWFQMVLIYKDHLFLNIEPVD